MSNLIRDEMPGLHQALCENIGDTILYTPAVGSPRSIVVRWSAGPAVEQAEPGIAARVILQLSDLAAAPVDGADTITFMGKTYRVVRSDMDDYGTAILSLRFIGPA